MKPLSQVAQQITPSATLQVDALYKQMNADGIDVIGFGAGEPDYNTPDNIKKAAQKAIEENKTKYTPAAGIMPLRKAVTDRLKKDCGISYEAGQIIIASGAKHSIYITMQVLLNPGDEVIIPAPYWITYVQAIKMAHGVPVTIQTDETTNFKLKPETLAAAITDKTKILILCNPSNPTGMLYSADELQAIAEICNKHDLYIISDEIYYKLVYDNKKFTSMAALGDDIKQRTILINGVSKSYAMTGWRIGYTASNLQIAKATENYLGHSTSAPSTISQYAALEALSGSQESISEMRNEFEKRRNFIISRINEINGVSCCTPDGAFYIMMNIEKLIGKTLGGREIKNSDDFALALLEKGKVATVSCTDFGCKNYIRLTYAASMETIKKGMERIERFIC